MGILSLGRPLNYNEIVAVKSQLKSDALNDLISIFVKHRERRNDEFLWGDEVRLFLLISDKETNEID